MNWRQGFSDTLSRMTALLRKDWIYVALLCINLSVIGASFYSNHSDSSGNSVLSNKSTQGIRRDELLQKLMNGESSRSFGIIIGGIMAGSVAGIVLFLFFLVRGFPGRKRKGRKDIGYCEVCYELQEQVQISTLNSIAWNLWDVIKVVIIFFSAYIGFSLIQEIMKVCLHLSDKSVNTDFLLILDMLFSEIVAIFFLFRILRQQYGVDLNIFGLSLRRVGVYFLFGIASYLMFLPVFFLINALTMLISKLLSIDVQPQEIFYLFSQDSNFTTGQLRILIVFIVLLGPFFEEIFFRGFLYRVLKKYCGVFGALVISALFFAYIHHNFMAFLPIFALGIVLGLLVEHTGSLIPSVVMHCMVNSVSMAVLLTLISTK